MGLTAKQAKAIRKAIVALGDNAPDNARVASRNVSRALNNIAEGVNVEHSGAGATSSGDWEIPEKLAVAIIKAAEICGLNWIEVISE